MRIEYYFSLIGLYWCDMTPEVDHEVTEERSYPPSRLMSTIVAHAKDSEPHPSDVTEPAEKSSDNLRSSLIRVLKAIAEAFGRGVDSYGHLT